MSGFFVVFGIPAIVVVTYIFARLATEWADEGRRNSRLQPKRSPRRYQFNSSDWTG